MIGYIGGNIMGYLMGKGLTPAFTRSTMPEGIEASFAEHYRAHILPDVVEFEQRRVETLKIMRKRILISLAGLVALIVGAVMAAGWSQQNGKLVFGGIVLYIIGTFIWSCLPGGKYRKSIKDVIFPKIFSFFGPDYSYSQVSTLDNTRLQASDIIPYFDDWQGEDHVTGKYKSVTFEMTEATLTTKHRDSKGRTRTVTVFKGMFVLFTLTQRFHGKTIMVRDGGKIGNWISSKFKDLKRVGLVDPKFEKLFEVYSNDQVESRYLVHPAFIERCVELAALVSGDASGRSKLQMSFFNNQLLLMIESSKNRFEPKHMFAPATFVDDINEILKEMQIINTIVDVLKIEDGRT